MGRIRDCGLKSIENYSIRVREERQNLKNLKRA